MKVADGVEMLDLKMSSGVHETSMHPTLIWDDKNVILVDAGLPGNCIQIRKKIVDSNVLFDKLNRIIITHQDLDHIGSISDILKASPHKIQVLAHKEEKPYIQGDKKLDKMSPEQKKQLNKRLESMPEKQREQMKALFQPQNVQVDKTVEDGEKLPYCGGIIIIHTGGHTPGHICLYLEKNKTLIAGDIMNIVDGELVGANPQHTMDMDLAKNSLKKFTKYDIENVITYHGGLFNKDANQKIAELTK